MALTEEPLRPRRGSRSANPPFATIDMLRRISQRFVAMPRLSASYQAGH